MIRDDIKAALVTAMKAGDKPRTATLRLVQSAIKNRDIELRAPPAEIRIGRGPAQINDPSEGLADDSSVIEVLQKMIKQRRESIALYEQGGRAELAAAEQAEVAVIEGFLPRQMSDEEAKAAVDAIVSELGAGSLKDMGRVMAALRERHAGQVDMAKASALVKARLSA